MTEEVSFYYNKAAIAYGSTNKSEDSFDFTAPSDDEESIALLLPAVQKVETASEPIGDFAGAEEDDGAVGYTLVELLEIRGRSRVDDGGEWIDILSVDQGVSRSDGGGDFMF